MLLACTTISGNFSSITVFKKEQFDVELFSLALGIDLQSQLAAMQFENRQIIRRFLDRDFPLSGSIFSLAVLRTALVAQDGSDGL